jgi:hypothetical protein
MADDEGAPAGEEAAQLRDELQAAWGEVARLEVEAANAAGEAASLRSVLAEAQSAATAAAAETDGLRVELDDASKREREVAARYRELMLRVEPSLPADMIAGDTIDEIEASVMAAREIVGRVRAHIDAQPSAARVPAGAPQRASIDLSTMTPQQKIRYGLEQRASQG